MREAACNVEEEEICTLCKETRKRKSNEARGETTTHRQRKREREREGGEIGRDSLYEKIAGEQCIPTDSRFQFASNCHHPTPERS